MDKKVVIILDAFALDDYADSPLFAAVIVDQSYIDRMKERFDSLSKSDFTEASTQDCVEMWGSREFEKEVRLCYPELNLFNNKSCDFYYSDSAKNGGSEFETKMIDLPSLISIFNKAKHASFVLVGENAECCTKKEPFIIDMIKQIKKENKSLFSKQSKGMQL